MEAGKKKCFAYWSGSLTRGDIRDVRMRSADTDPEAERVQLDLLRRAGVEGRTALALSLTRMTMEMAWRAIQELHPEADADELAVHVVSHLYGAEIGEALRHHLAARRRRASP